MSYTDRAIRMHVRNQAPGVTRPEDTPAYRILTEGAREALGDFVLNKCDTVFNKNRGGSSIMNALIEGLREHYASAYYDKLGGDEHIAEYTLEQLLDITRCYILADHLSDGPEILDRLGI